MAVKIEEATYEELYEETEKGGAGGILMIVVIFLEFFMPLIIFMIGDYPLRLLTEYREFITEGYRWILPVLRLFLVALMIFSFVIAKRLNRLQMSALFYTKIFLLVELMFLMCISGWAFQISAEAFSDTLLQSQMSLDNWRKIGLDFSHIGNELFFRLLISTINFVALFGYLTFSGRVREVFLPENLGK